jgi:methyl-accepting chemotaxis protein
MREARRGMNLGTATGSLLRRNLVASVAAAMAASGVAVAIVFSASGSLWMALATTGLLAAVGGGFVDIRARRAARFLDQLELASANLAEGRELERIDESELGSLAGMGASFNRIFDGLGGVATRVLSRVQGVRGLPERIEAVMIGIEASSDAQEEAVEETASLLANINTSIGGINQRVENLSNAADESSSSILEMGSSVDEVARNAASLHESVEACTSSVHEMSASIRQVADSAESVQRMAEESASSMVEMDRAVQEVGAHVREASSLTEKVTEGAEQGAHAVTATIEDIGRIRTLTHDAKQGLEQLVSRISEIGEILKVIGDINDETNLLSLNAAIIAAQAGEQGKAFLVVANHVKVLAQRTASSTKDIAQLIHAVEAESDSAVSAMDAGMDAIEQGVNRSRVAGESLASIRRSAHESSTRVSEIERATEEQTRTSTLVARAVQDTSVQVQQISAAMAEQSSASDEMMRNSEAALDMCRHVHRSTEEQRETGRYITGSISSITEMIRAIQEGTASHARASQSVSDAVMRLLDNARKSGEHIPEVQAMMSGLSESAEAIVAELGPFEQLGGAASGSADRDSRHPDDDADY